MSIFSPSSGHVYVSALPRELGYMWLWSLYFNLLNVIQKSGHIHTAHEVMSWGHTIHHLEIIGHLYQSGDKSVVRSNEKKKKNDFLGRFIAEKLHFISQVCCRLKQQGVS